jgi:hypothetical protein
VDFVWLDLLAQVRGCGFGRKSIRHSDEISSQLSATSRLHAIDSF